VVARVVSGRLNQLRPWAESMQFCHHVETAPR
jgi:hypothetical protein